MRTKDRALSAAIVEWVMQNATDRHTLALTLTTKHKMIFNSKNKDAIDACATKELSYVRQKVNTEIFGSNWRRKGKCLNMFTFREEIDNKPHFHLLIELTNTNPMAIKAIGEMFIKYWQQTSIGGKYNKIKAVDDVRGWVSYCTKSLTKHDTRVIDVENTVINQVQI